MLKIVGDSPKGNALTELILLDDKFRPTPLLLGLVALELCIDVLVGYTAYRAFKNKSESES